MLAPVRYLISVLVWPTSARQVWVFSRSKITMARMQPTNDPIGTRINKRIIARIPSPAFGCRGVINQPIKMLVKRPAKAPATIHPANSPIDHNLFLEDTGTAYHVVSQIGDFAENRFWWFVGGPSAIDGNIGSSTFGAAIGAAPPRILQGALKLNF